MEIEKTILSQFEEFYEKMINNENFTTRSLLGTVAVIASSYLFYSWWGMKRFFKRMKIPGPTPSPIFGNFIGMIKKGIANYDIEIFKKYNSNIVGYYEATTPVILCRDVDMAKHVMIKDFNYFVNRRNFDSFGVDIFKDFLTQLRDDEWKNVRSIVTTTFTSGKLKQMIDNMEPCIESLSNYMNKLCDSGEFFDARELFQKFTFDIITSTCFGMQTDSINNPNDPFIKNIKEVLSAQISFKFFLIILFPRLCKRLIEWNIMELIPSKGVNFFKDFINMMIEQRKNKELVRNDFIQMMIEHEDNNDTQKNVIDENIDDNSNIKWKSLKKSLTNNEILSQAFIFLIAGSDTTASTMTFISYLLAKHPDIQKRLYEEILKAYQENDNKIDYDMVNKIEYLEMVIDETLRLFPAVLRLDRQCNQEYKYKDITIPKGSIWNLCIWALHHDPNIYPDPEKFDPERFNPENKKKRDNCAFLPFGTGPRNCIGLRFALLEIKLLYSQIMLKYEFSVCDKTPEKIEIDNSGLAKSKVPIILKISKRN